MEDQDPVVQPVENTAEAAKKKKLSGDARTLVIALLTSIIVVLLYHSITKLVCCLTADSCRKNAPVCTLIPENGCPKKFNPEFSPPADGRKHHHRHPGRRHHRHQHQVTPENNAGETAEINTSRSAENQ